MKLAEFFEAVRAKGYSPTLNKLRYAVANGHVDEPESDDSGRSVYSAKTLSQFCTYLAFQRRRRQSLKRVRAAAAIRKAERLRAEMHAVES